MDMRTFSASEELAQILLKHGFTEIMKSKFPTHPSEIVKNGDLGAKSKRIFVINSKDSVVFDYGMIKVCHNGECNDLNMKPVMSVNEIKSIIAFFNLPSQTRTVLIRDRYAIPKLFEMYDYIKENPTYKKPRNKFIVSAFENVVL